jgi:hypothetical protein
MQGVDKDYFAFFAADLVVDTLRAPFAGMLADYEKHRRHLA